MKNKPHDLGGSTASQVDHEEPDYEAWEKHVDALLVLLSGEKKLLRVDELRRGIESLGREAYDELSYYERWTASISKILVEKHILTQMEIDQRVREIATREDPQ